MPRKTAFVATAAASVAMLIAACGSSSGGSGGGGSGSGPITIGASVSLTGTYAGDGSYAKEGYEYAVAQINKSGGLLGRKVKLNILDDKSDPGTAVQLYTKLISQDNVDLLLGPYSSGISQAVIPLVDKFQKPTIFTEASSPTIFKNSKYALQGQVSSFDYFNGLVDFAKQQGYKTIAMVQQNVIATQEICAGAAREMKQAGIKVVYSGSYPMSATDFSSLVLGMKNAHPDMVLGCAYLPDSEGIAKEMNQQGLKPKLFAESIGPVEPQFKQSLGNVANGVITSTAWWPTLHTAGNAAFVSGYHQMFGHDPDYHAADAYAGAMVLAAAVKKAGSLDSGKLNQILHTSTFPTVLGTYKVNSSGQEQAFTSYLLQWQNGALKLVWPNKAAEAKPQFPYSG